MSTQFDANSLVPVIVEFGYSFAIGMALGWGLRRAFKWVVVIVGIMIGFTVVYQFFGGGDTSLGLSSHYETVAPVLERSFSIFTQFLDGNIVRMGGFGIGLLSGLSSGNKEN